MSKAIFAKAWAVTVVDLLGLRKCLHARFSYPPDDPQQNDGGFPLYQGITNSLVSDSLGILCNDFCEGRNTSPFPFRMIVDTGVTHLCLLCLVRYVVSLDTKRSIVRTDQN